FNVPITTFKEMHYRRVVHQRYDYSCGSAALATLLTYHYERPTLESTALKWMFEHGDQEKIRKEGFSLLDMKRYLASIGLDGEGYRVTLDKIAQVGIPGIILVNVKGYSHFVVLKGIRGDKVLVGDPALGAKLMTREDVEKIWTGVFFTIASGGKEAKACRARPCCCPAHKASEEGPKNEQGKDGHAVERFRRVRGAGLDPGAGCRCSGGGRLALRRRGARAR